MLLKEFSCKQCGNCCRYLSGAFITCADEEDIEQWEKMGRSDILEWVSYLPLGENSFVYDIWIDPKTGDDVHKCHWLRKLPKKDMYVCRIHAVSHCIAGHIRNHKNMLRIQIARDLIDGNRGTRGNSFNLPSNIDTLTIDIIIDTITIWLM
jgi:hypothetical protein